MAKIGDIGSIEITKYFVNDKGRIEISHIKALDKDGKYIKFMPHILALKVLPKRLCIWKEQKDES